MRTPVPAVLDDGSYHPALDAIRGKCSGVYVIFDARTRACLYVGESHTGRLFDTLTRHFRAWHLKPRDSTGGRRGGTSYDRRRVDVSWQITSAGAAVAAQDDAIRLLEPRDNIEVPADDGYGDVPV